MMCRGQDNCIELGTLTGNWDKECPLRPPKWFESEISFFESAVDHFLNGDKATSLDIISRIRSAEMADWFIEHGQMSGRHRALRLNVRAPEITPTDQRDPNRSPRRLQVQVFERDGYRCRYCGNRLISQKFMKSFIQKFDSPNFQRGTTNLGTHGIVHATWPVADHVIPWNYGGRTDLGNLVSSCASCNYGKDGYTYEQLGIQNPFLREPIVDGWDGASTLSIRTDLKAC